MLRRPMSTLTGFVAIVVYVACSFASFARYPSRFRVTENYLSDLGNSVSNPRGAALYNIGIILTGLALLPFFAGLVVWHSKTVARTRLVIAAQALGVVEAIALVMIGVYPENTGAPHLVWSNVQFFVNMLVLSISTFALSSHPRFIRGIGVYALLAIASQLAALVLIALGRSSPLIEWLAVLTTLLFVGLLSLNMSRAFSRAR